MQLITKVSLFLTLAGLLSARAWTVTSHSSTFTVGNSSYYVPGTAVASLNISANSSVWGRLQALTEGGLEPLIPFTFITTSSSTFSEDDLYAAATLYAQVDDVWSPGFLTGQCFAFISAYKC